MSILDGLYAEGIDPAVLADKVRRGIDLARRNMPPEAGELLSLLAEGVSLADIAGLGEQHKEALFQLGCRLMVCDEVGQAEAIFTTLSLLDPLEARAHYGAGVARQVKGDVEGAAQSFLLFLALDATDPNGYLRLGECLTAAGEFDEAQSAFQVAVKLAENGHGSQATIDEATRQISLISQR